MGGQCQPISDIKEIGLRLVDRGAFFTWDKSSSEIPTAGLFPGVCARQGK